VKKTNKKAGTVFLNEEINVIGKIKSIKPINNSNRDFSFSITYTITANVINAVNEPRIILFNFN
jgi:hypothetical protein|tara:strand:+ start:606 stop:797 length:192 start_codon:yes stop_codon:yes gene_type:complete